MYVFGGNTKIGFDSLQTYSVFAKDKRPTQQTLATNATTGDQSKADSADKPRADSGDQK